MQSPPPYLTQNPYHHHPLKSPPCIFRLLNVEPYSIRGLPRELYFQLRRKVKPSRRLLPRLSGRGKDPVGLVGLQLEVTTTTDGQRPNERRSVDTREFLRNHFMWRVGRVFFPVVPLLYRSRYSNVMHRPIRGVEKESLRIVHQLATTERLSPQRFATCTLTSPRPPTLRRWDRSVLYPDGEKKSSSCPHINV